MLKIFDHHQTNLVVDEGHRSSISKIQKGHKSSSQQPQPHFEG